MKEIVIKIPDEAKQAFDNAENNELKGGFYDHGGVIASAIRNGIVLDGLTNMELITRIINPDSDDCVGIECEDGIVTFKATEDAWNRKWGEQA